MKYLLATFLYTLGCYLVFGIERSWLLGIGLLVLTGGSLALIGKKEITKPVQRTDFIPRGSTLIKNFPGIFGIILLATIMIVLGEDALITVLESRAVGLAFWLFLVALVVHRYLTERTNIQPDEPCNAEKPPGVERTP